MQQAKTHLSALLARVEAGEEITVARGDIPIARIVPLRPPGERELGFVPYEVPDEFFAPLDEDELRAWEA